MLLQGEVEALAPLLYQIACDLRCDAYTDLYCRDFPHLFDLHDDLSQVTQGKKLHMICISYAFKLKGNRKIFLV